MDAISKMSKISCQLVEAFPDGVWGSAGRNGCVVEIMRPLSDLSGFMEYVAKPVSL